MNRHFFNFIAMFNAAAKTRKLSFVMPLRNKFVLTYLDFLLKRGLIASYEFEKSVPDLNSHRLKLGKKNSPYHYPIRVYMRVGLVKRIRSISTPSHYYTFTRKKLAGYVSKWAGATGIVIVSSARLGKISDAREVLALGEGALVLSVIYL